MNQPKQPDDPPQGGTSPDANPTGTTPHGIPDGQSEHDAKGYPTDTRHDTETAPLT